MSGPISVAVEAMTRLHQAGWSIGDVVFQGDDGRPRWLVSGSNGENLIQAEGATAAEAWAGAEDQARSLGMLRRPEADAPWSE